jgi:hypothetical protein
VRLTILAADFDIAKAHERRIAFSLYVRRMASARKATTLGGRFGAGTPFLSPSFGLEKRGPGPPFDPPSPSKLP